MLSPSLEDYLEEIYRSYLNNKAIRATDIAQCLNVTLPSVHHAIQRLSKEGYLIYERYREIELSEKGKRAGRFLVERNSILRELLTLLEVDCNIEQEAEAIEHYLSLPTIRALESLLDFLQKHPSFLQAYLSHCQYRNARGLGLKDTYSHPCPE
ncbi:MAG TPA: DNA-binding protein [Syntrophomonadaceae bacterium]|nr:DNA-binding protein [Syntrophomonadaceae bacterium]